MTIIQGKSMSLHALLMLTISSPIITITNNSNKYGNAVMAWSPANRLPLQLSSASLSNNYNNNVNNMIIGGHANKYNINSRLFMSNNNEEERRPIAREGEWSAYMDENYDRVYYFNHESVSST